MVERLPYKQMVIGSNPISPIFLKAILDILKLELNDFERRFNQSHHAFPFIFLIIIEGM